MFNVLEIAMVATKVFPEAVGAQINKLFSFNKSETLNKLAVKSGRENSKQPQIELYNTKVVHYKI